MVGRNVGERLLAHNVHAIVEDAADDVTARAEEVHHEHGDLALHLKQHAREHRLLVHLHVLSELVTHSDSGGVRHDRAPNDRNLVRKLHQKLRP